MSRPLRSLLIGNVDQRVRYAPVFGAGRPKGFRLSPTSRKRISVSLTGRRLSTEHRADIAAGQLGRKHSPETRAKIAATRHYCLNTPEAKAKRAAAWERRRARGPSPLKGRPKSIETRIKIGARLRGRTLSEVTRAKISAAKIGKPGRQLSPEERARFKVFRAEQLSDPVREGRRIAAAARALGQHPNRLERQVLTWLEKMSPAVGWQFNPGVVVAKKIPDFVRTDGLRLAVDVHGDYHHRFDTTADLSARQATFKEAGWRLVIIWESEFKKDPAILSRRIRRALLEISL